MQERVLFADAFLSQPFILRRLFYELGQATGEFRQNPRGYMASAISGDGLGGRRRRMLLMYGMAIAILLCVVFYSDAGRLATHPSDCRGEEDERF
jgi:hypothetical protein